MNVGTSRTEEWIIRLDTLLAQLHRQKEAVKASVKPKTEQTKKRASKKR
jgi:hypothetical protein